MDKYDWMLVCCVGIAGAQNRKKGRRRSSVGICGIRYGMDKYDWILVCGVGME